MLDGAEVRPGEVELVARVLGGGAWVAAAALLARFGTVAALARADVAEVGRVRGIGRRRAERLAAALALGRRALESAPEAADPVLDAAGAYAWLGPPLLGLGVEELHALYLDRRSRPLAHRRLTRGSDAFTVVDPRQVFRAGVALGAAGVVLAHNHPSGDPTPSPQDREVTRRVAGAGRVVGVDLVDHLVVAGERFTSMRACGDLVVADPVRAAWTA